MSAIHFATRLQCAFAGYLPSGGEGRFGFAICLGIFVRKGLENKGLKEKELIDMVEDEVISCR